MKKRPSKALIDADYMVYRVGFSSKDVSSSIACSRIEEQLMDLVYVKLKCEDYDAFITGKTNFRYEVATTHPYKGNRKSLEKPAHYEALRDKLVSLGATVSVNQEADDDVGIASTLDYGWIVHVDKDLNQLPGWHYNPIKGEEYFVTVDEGSKSFYLQLLTGDRIDNIVGLNGIGPVKASKLLAGLTKDHELYQAVKAAYESKEEPVERILENGQLLWLSRYEGQRWEPPKEAE
jgi:5'-3' exonuclease